VQFLFPTPRQKGGQFLEGADLLLKRLGTPELRELRFQVLRQRLATLGVAEEFFVGLHETVGRDEETDFLRVGQVEDRLTARGLLLLHGQFQGEGLGGGRLYNPLEPRTDDPFKRPARCLTRRNPCPDEVVF